MTMDNRGAHEGKVGLLSESLQAQVGLCAHVLQNTFSSELTTDSS